MQTILLSESDISYLNSLEKSNLFYNIHKNVVEGDLYFNLTYKELDETIKDTYSISIDLSKVNDNGIPIVRETRGRVLSIAKKYSLPKEDMHLNSYDGAMCLIFPWDEKSKYPNGFDLKILIEHIQEHLYGMSYFEKYKKEAWSTCKHGYEEYFVRYIDNPAKYKKKLRLLLKNPCNTKFRKVIKSFKKKFNYA